METQPLTKPADSPKPTPSYLQPWTSALINIIAFLAPSAFGLFIIHQSHLTSKPHFLPARLALFPVLWGTILPFLSITSPTSSPPSPNPNLNHPYNIIDLTIDLARHASFILVYGSGLITIFAYTADPDIIARCLLGVTITSMVFLIFHLYLLPDRERPLGKLLHAAAEVILGWIIFYRLMEAGWEYESKLSTSALPDSAPPDYSYQDGQPLELGYRIGIHGMSKASIQGSSTITFFYTKRTVYFTILIGSSVLVQYIKRRYPSRSELLNEMYKRVELFHAVVPIGTSAWSVAASGLIHDIWDHYTVRCILPPAMLLLAAALVFWQSGVSSTDEAAQKGWMAVLRGNETTLRILVGLYQFTVTAAVMISFL